MSQQVSQNEIEWLSLEVIQQADGAFVGYESLSDNRCEGNWNKIRQWIYFLLNDTEDAIKGEEIG